MAVDVKICGLSTPETVAAAVDGGARFVGFVFFAPSPRAVTPAQAALLSVTVPGEVCRVGLVVDASDAEIEGILAGVSLDMLQLHGRETPERVAAVRARTGLPVMKAVAVEGVEDIEHAKDYEAAADWLLFDAKPPSDATRPGGNATAFDWSLMAGRQWRVPWMLAGGLSADTLSHAAAASGARAMDVSSGVEDAPGVKSVARVREFLAAAAGL